ncbi:MAG: ATP-binding protein [Gammaproteobacteria bacterium]|nr:ATP-binding protein [Gammaproteobacteria bacterium]
MFHSLSNRLIIAILAVLALLGTLGGLLITRIGQLDDATSRILAANVQITHTINGMDQAMAAYRQAGTSGARGRADAQFATVLRSAKIIMTAPAAQAELGRVAQAWGAYKQHPSRAAFLAAQTRLHVLQAAERRVTGHQEHRAIHAIRDLTLFATLGLIVALFVMLVFSLWVVRLIVRPLRHLAHSIHDLSPAGAHRELERYTLSEFDDVTREFNGLLRRLEKYERGNVDKLVFENAKIDALINSIDDGLILLDRQGKILHVNFMAGMLLQTEPGELLGRNINDLNIATRFYINLRNALGSLRREDQEEPQYSRNEFSLTIRGRLHSYILKTVPFRDKRRSTIGLIVVLQDVTELRHAEHQRTQLLATLSHELKTPLTSLSLSIGSLYETAEQDHYPHHVRQLLDVGKEEIYRLTQLVEDLLDVSRPDAIRTSIDLKTFELCEFLRRQAHSFRLQADLQDVDLVLSCVPDLTINADPVKLGWVFNNLLSNALRHTPVHGQVMLAARPEEGKDQVLIEVADTGRGIPPEELPQIFEWFTQGAAGSGSAGMGLAIVREMVEAHGGRIEVQSQLHQGTRFLITLPHRPTAASLPLQPTVPAPDGG